MPCAGWYPGRARRAPEPGRQQGPAPRQSIRGVLELSQIDPALKVDVDLGGQSGKALVQEHALEDERGVIDEVQRNRCHASTLAMMPSSDRQSNRGPSS